tara:strand:- start:870 stop:1127 length:258 start_codon:yes stop_codon:yes gene_type:complete
VTRYPPTTLRLAKKTAIVPRAIVILEESPPEDKIAPTRVIPEIAFAPDIKGVCRVDGTLLISSKPKNIERTRTNSNSIISIKLTP